MMLRPLHIKHEERLYTTPQTTGSQKHCKLPGRAVSGSGPQLVL